jgi:hypothetical protein
VTVHVALSFFGLKIRLLDIGCHSLFASIAGRRFPAFPQHMSLKQGIDIDVNIIVIDVIFTFITV